MTMPFAVDECPEIVTRDVISRDFNQYFAGAVPGDFRLAHSPSTLLSSPKWEGRVIAGMSVASIGIPHACSASALSSGTCHS
ncbi:hypothetical protein CDAR_416401 [Caerostris darwini]|uniref:Uncharacterized protein n=1 Tax=Caerostris darwini TaxID=1538125 RepID=A0AAV4WA60_9ARAC|nr:hypothetical protein CDAR_416401 [Caerostris darwini]